MAKYSEGNQNMASKDGSQSDYNLTKETESVAEKDYYSQTKEHQFHKHFYYFGPERSELSLERMAYNLDAISVSNLTWEELYIMHMKLKPVQIFTARFTVNTRLSLPTDMTDYSLYTKYMFHYEEKSTSSYTTQVSRIVTQTEILESPTEKHHFHKKYYFRESKQAFKRASHNDINPTWREFHLMHTSCLKSEPMPIYTASLSQNCTSCTRYADMHMHLRAACEIIVWSTDDTYLMFNYQENIRSMSSNGNEITLPDIDAAAANSTIARSRNFRENFHENLTNDRTLAYLEDDISLGIYARNFNSSTSHHNDQANDSTVTVTSFSGNTASNSTQFVHCTSKENKGTVAKCSNKNFSERNDKKRHRRSWCVIRYTNYSYHNSNRRSYVFTNRAMLGNTKRSSRSSAYKYAAGATVTPFLGSDVVIAIITIIIIIIIALLILRLIYHFIKKCFLQPKPKRNVVPIFCE